MKYIVSIVLACLSCLAHSAPMSENISICYQFNNDKLIKRSACIVDSGYGAGGSYINIEQGKSVYLIETESLYDKKNDSYNDGETTLNDIAATSYFRNLFYKKITDKSLISENSLSCFMTKNKKIDVCYK